MLIYTKLNYLTINLIRICLFYKFNYYLMNDEENPLEKTKSDVSIHKEPLEVNDEDIKKSPPEKIKSESIFQY